MQLGARSLIPPKQLGPLTPVDVLSLHCSGHLIMLTLIPVTLAVLSKWGTLEAPQASESLQRFLMQCSASGG
eukprot:11006133-Karenia_brevis.AAC.1